jgi:hypothetical protein
MTKFSLKRSTLLHFYDWIRTQAFVKLESRGYLLSFECSWYYFVFVLYKIFFLHIFLWLFSYYGIYVGIIELHAEGDAVHRHKAATIVFQTWCKVKTLGLWLSLHDEITLQLLLHQISWYFLSYKKLRYPSWSMIWKLTLNIVHST